ncbi:MAG: hypothetical protein NZ900_07875 [Synergistetes bacterium]|nr:hypothetical protein [Synergistota bacterium]MDW8192838.1 hypothetical protein [Synergistota bacterium]
MGNKRLSKYAEDKERLFMEEVSFSEIIDENRVLTISAKKMTKINSVIKGENILLQLKKENDETIIYVHGGEGNCDFNEAKVVFSNGVLGRFGKLEWVSNNLLWNIRTNEVRADGKIKFRVKGWSGSSNEMVIYLNKGLVMFLEGVEISSNGD